MPKLNTRGDYVAGGGGTQGSVNGTLYPFPTDGGGVWLDDDTIIVQRKADSVLVRMNAHNFAADVIQPPRGATAIGGGGGKWLAHLPGVGLYGDVPNAPLFAAGLPSNAVGRDGTRVYTPDAQVGFGYHGFNPDGSTFDVDGSTPFGVQVLGPNTVIWQGGAYGRQPPRPALTDAQNIRIVPIHGLDWLVYWSESTGFIAQPDGAQEGWLLDTRPLEFNYDVISEGDSLLIAWSVTAGERPEDIVLCRVYPDAVSYPKDAANWEPQFARWQRLEPPVELPKIGRPCWIGAFEFDQAAGIAPGNTLVAVRHWQGHAPRPFVLTDETAHTLAGDILGHFLSGDTVQAIEQAAASSVDRPVVYWDARTWPWWPQVPPGSWICVQAYQRANESLAAFEADMRAILGSAPAGAAVALVCQQYTSNSSLTTDIRPQIPVYLRLARDHPNVVALLLFSGYGRAWGLNDHADCRSDWARVVAETAVPAFEPYHPPPHPPSKPYYQAKEYHMAGSEVGAIRSLAGKFGRLLEEDKGKALFGYYALRFDRDSPDDDCWWTLTKPDTRYMLAHTKVHAILGADGTEHGDKTPVEPDQAYARLFYGKPGGQDARGILEAPVLIYDPASSLIVGYVTWPDKGLAAPSFVWVKQ